MQRTSFESGNVFFMIMMGVALFAALTYAVAMGARSFSGQVMGETENLAATEFIQYAEAFADSVTQMRLRGVAVASLCFDDSHYGHADYNHATCASASNKVYDPAGGAVIWAQPEAKWFVTGATRMWDIDGTNAIAGVGTTCASASCADLTLHINGLTQQVCEKINLRLAITGSTAGENALWTAFAGSFAYVETLGAGVAVGLYGQSAACFKDSMTDEYVFYKVLIAR